MQPIEIQPAYGGVGIAGVEVHSGSNHSVAKVVQARQFMVHDRDVCQDEYTVLDAKPRESTVGNISR